ncbi:MAG: hypothetical protein ISS34_06105 [Candidatus Omnitrophica bacterium]|nr:hypothetical protein [Candidatus Omnitrophota bacterium]
MTKKVLLMYISHNSGHHRACLALENALQLVSRGIQTKCINSFHYTNPILEKIINKTYMAVIKKKPEVWGYLYDNPVVVKKSQRLKESIHKFNSTKMKRLIDDFKPDAIVCTQAFPCGMVADLKKTYKLDIPLFGILTDYAPHSYWIYDNVTAYVVPSIETGRKLIENGISEEKVRPIGIPVHPKFYKKCDQDQLMNKYSLNKDKPVILIMGGGQGLGPIKNLVLLLDKSPLDVQVIVVTGINKRLHKFLLKKKASLKKNPSVFAFTEDIDELMGIATLVITKPGGLTTAEAMSKRLPMIILNPLPGQESMNTEFLKKRRLAVEARDEKETLVILEGLLDNPQKLTNIRQLIDECTVADTSLKIARLVLGAS